MRFGDILRLCRQNLWRRKSRTILTVLGVIVGCCSIVLMISLGQGINEQNEKMLKQMGDLSIVTVYTSGGGRTNTGSGTTEVKLDDKALESFRSLGNVSGVTPVMNLPYNATLKAGSGGRYVADFVQIMGIDMTQFDQMGYTIKDGSMPVRDGQVLAGEWLAYDFMDTLRGGEMRYANRGDGSYSCTYNEATGQCEEPEDQDPYFDPMKTRLTLVTGTDYQGSSYSMQMMGGGSGSGTGSQSETVTVDLTVSGITKADQSKGYSTSSGLVMDLKDLKALIAKVDPSTAKKTSTTYDQAFVKVTDLSSVPEVESQIKAMGFDTSSYEDMRKSLEEQSRAIQLILGGIGAVSLLVAAIGIANTMVMSVTERTREIGIMKALGCYVRDIRVMFLAEAGAIGFFGGLIGCIISGLISLAINLIGMTYLSSMMYGAPEDAASLSFGERLWQALVGGEDVTRYSVIPWWLFGFAILFSTLIGLLFGFGPANKAVKIPALDAIKNSE
ncbi:Permease protein of ABC transporter system [Bifidobacterium reuteri DSM 23975]|uniref:Permease protein of ABC transporter system n=1 Tax=Bifidobacterium reuteri DSM 23975 TaxID=1437610 RepID=A0A087CXD0_9BIFI|nr:MULTISPECIES: ABC transporter permease [Bifidobacterium]KFI87930.1 Permease protein of ABC transporter system [Bifidobacterium reuteri DSM 23975]TPF93740.1 peptide ABC transporter permease [Bifidobacterium sp. UTBIF-68]